MWFATHGFACLIIDTLQLGEIAGTHHGTYRYDRWWWQSRGYSPAAIECWNGIRALDYLQERPEIDRDRLAVTSSGVRPASRAFGNRSATSRRERISGWAAGRCGLKA